MNDTNLVVLTGGITRDPEVKYTPKGTAVTELSLAVTGSDKVGNEWKDRVDYFNATVWGRTAENCAEFLKKGSQVLIEGSLRLETWEKDGVKQYKTKVIAQKVQFLTKPKVERAAKKEHPEDRLKT